MALQWKAVVFLLVARAVAGVQFEGPRLVTMSESGTTNLRVVREQAFSSSSETSVIVLLTIDQYLGGAGSQLCQLRAADLGLANSSTFDPAEATDFPDGLRINITFLSGQTYADVELTISGDDVAEKNEVFIAALESSETNCAVVIELQDEDVVRISFNKASFQDETVNGNFTQMKLVKQGSNEVDFEVTVQPETGTATENVDFVLEKRRFLFTPSTFEVVVPITILDDNISESIETVLICLPTNIEDTPIRVEPSPPSCSEISLIDDDDEFVGFPGLPLSNPTITITEGESGNLTFGFLGRLPALTFFTEILVSLSPLDGITDNRITVGNSMYGSIAGPIIDPTPQAFQLTSMFSTIRSPVSAIQNNAVDGTATFNFSLNSMVGAAQNQPVTFASQMAVLVILDDDSSEFNIMLQSPNPSDSREGQTVQFVITRSPNPIHLVYTATVSVTPDLDFMVNPSSFIFDNNTLSLPGSITFLDNDIPGATLKYNIGVDVTSSIPLSVPPVTSSMVVTIMDDDAHTFTISPGTVSATEGQAGPIPFLITKSPQTATTSYTVTVGVQQAGYESDFTLSRTTYTFEPSTSTREGIIIVGDDRMNKGRHVFNISIIDFQYTTSVRPIAAGSVELTIVDNDYTVGFLGNTAEVTVEEGSETEVILAITSPTGAELGPPGLSFDLQLSLTQQEKSEDDKNLLQLATKTVTFTSTNYNATLKIVSPKDDGCANNQKYLLTFSYTGSQLDIINGTISAITFQIKDDDCAGALRSAGTCIVCIVVPIVIIIGVLLCLLCLLLILCCLWCCKRKCWRSYDPGSKEMKYGDLRKAYS